MKSETALLMGAVLLFCGCEYETPLTEEHSIAVDSSVLGLWEVIPDKGKEKEQNKRMMILKYYVFTQDYRFNPLNVMVAVITALYVMSKSH